MLVRVVLPFCSNCGKEVAIDAKFCESCGHALQGSPQKNIGMVSEPILTQRISDMSRLSRVGIQKFLGPDERIIFSTARKVWCAKQRRFGYVTNKRVLFYYRIPKLLGVIKEDRLDEIFIREVRRLSLTEKGFLRKIVLLYLDEMEIEGDRGDVLGLYKAVQSAREIVRDVNNT